MTCADRDGAALDPPLGEDGLVLAVVDEHLERGQHRLREPAVLRHGQPVGGVLDRGPDELELAAGLLDLVVGHRRVGEAELGTAAGQGQVGAVLVREREHVHGRLAGLLALRALRLRVGLLGGSLLHRDGLAADVADARDVGAAGRLGEERLAGDEVVNEVDGLLALLGVGERRGADVVLARGEARDDAVERLVDDLDLEAHQGTQSVHQVGVHPHHGLAVGPDELVGRVAGIGGDREGALGLDRGRHGHRAAPARRRARTGARARAGSGARRRRGRRGRRGGGRRR